MSAADTIRYEVAIVGAGQAGLAIGRLLAEQGRRFVILEAADHIGAAWRERWDSLVLFTPRRYDALPGLDFPGDPDGYPARDEVIEYLERHADHFGLPVELSSPVRKLTHDGSTFVLEAGDRTILADQVVVATGPFQRPRVPALAGELGPDVFQAHSAGYRRPGDVPQSRVLVAGGGNTGFQIAAELARTHEVHLAIGSRQTPLPQRLLGRDLFWWLTKLGLLRKTVDSRVGRRASGRDTLIGSSPRRIRRLGVRVHPRLVRAQGRTAAFADGGELAVDAVIWATGYAPDHSWIQLPVHEEDGRIRHRRGVTGVHGLYFVGLSWQHTRGSALLGFVGDDAAFIAAQIAAHTQGAAEAADIEPDGAAPEPAGVGEGQMRRNR
ncbi:MAG TPA: NAD(P)/FAD-dependent oxidoreductase [Gaiellales bacterium]|nr:NAD(P)/FAD-dependent oxidoreductase [Gaiellales bacterium]